MRRKADAAGVGVDAGRRAAADWTAHTAAYDRILSGLAAQSRSPAGTAEPEPGAAEAKAKTPKPAKQAKKAKKAKKTERKGKDKAGGEAKVSAWVCVAGGGKTQRLPGAGERSLDEHRASAGADLTASRRSRRRTRRRTRRRGRRRRG